MGFHIPESLTADFLQSCLRSDERNFKDIVVTRYCVEPAVTAGNNYGSQLLRVKLNYRKPGDDKCEYVVSLIVKAPVEGGFMEHVGGEYVNDVYLKEPNYYNKFISETYSLCEHDTVPKHYKSPNPYVMVMEDLKDSGYVMVNRHELLDKEQTELYIKASAKLHALSVAVNNKNPELIQSLVFEDPKFKEHAKGFFQILVQKGLNCLIAYMREQKYDQYADIIQEYLGLDLFQVFDDMDNADRKVKAITQNDPWCTNMLFKYDSQGVSKIKLIDFQGLKFTTPVSELVTFTWASIKPEVRKKHLDEFYKLYCDSINENLEKLGCPQRLSYDDLMKDVSDLSPLVIMVLSMMLPFCISDGVGVDISSMMSTQEDPSTPIKETKFYELYQGQTFQKYYPQIIEEAASRAVFTNLQKIIAKYQR